MKNAACKLLALGMSGLVVPAYAQDAVQASRPDDKELSSEQVQAQGGDSSNQESVIDEIIVTAQRREERLQKVPLSISAFKEDTLQAAGVDSTDALSQMVPGLQTSRTLSSSTPFLRGVGTDSNLIGNEGAVATYIDGIFVGSSISAVQTFNNVDRVEVLKGPQGTLFGRNATGGVIHIITKTPQHTPGGSVSLGYGNYQTATFDAYGTTGLTEDLAADLAVYASDQGDGYGKNLVTGKDAQKTRALSLRSKWLWDLSETASATLTLDYAQRKSSTGIQRHLVKGAIGVDGTTIFDGGFQDAQEDQDSLGKVDEWGIGLRASNAFDGFKLVSLTSFRKTDEKQLLDVDAIESTIIHVNYPSMSETFAQEIQLISSNESRLQWQMGVFYLDSDARYDPNARFYGAAFAGLGFGEQIVEAGLKTDSIAAYAQGTYALDERNRLTMGARYTHDERKRYGDMTYTDPDGNVALVVPQGAKKDFDEPTWRVAFDHDLSDQAMLYASYSRGFKSGVFGSLDANPAVEPETVDAYEVGFKSTVLDGHLRLNGALFFYDYKDMQLQVVVDTLAVTTNAASSEIFGAELESIWVVADQLDLYANGSYLHTEFKRYPGATVNVPTGIGGNSQLIFDASGKELPNAPEFTMNVGGNYYVPLGPSGELKFNANLYHNGGFYWDALNRPKQESYQLLSAGVSWISPSKKTEVRISGRNLLDEEYGLYYGTLPFCEVISPAPPRTFGIEFKQTF